MIFLDITNAFLIQGDDKMNFFIRIMRTKKNTVCAPARGKIIRLENIPDKAFANMMVGDGLAIEITDNKIVAPCEGIISVIANTKHAFVMTLPNGLRLLVHIGINLTKPDANNFHFHVKTGDYVTLGAEIVTISDNLLKTMNAKIITPIIVCNHDIHPIKTFTTASYVETGKTIFTYK